MDGKDDDHEDELVFVVHMVPINGKSMQQMMELSMEVNLDEHNWDSMIGGNKRHGVSNPKTLMGIETHQGVQEVVALIWHDVDYEQLFFLIPFPIFKHLNRSK
jgi:hypothetical protein